MGDRPQMGRIWRNHDRQGQPAEWCTPPEIIEAIGLDYDLDPCAPAGGVPWIPARHHYSVEDDGLEQPWFGRVWLNPPYGLAMRRWLTRLAQHGNGIALIFARTDTHWWRALIPTADAVCFVTDRVRFLHPDGEPGPFPAAAPSVLIAWGADCANGIAAANLGLMFGVRSGLVAARVGTWNG